MKYISRGEIRNIYIFFCKYNQFCLRRVIYDVIFRPDWCPEIWDAILCWNSTPPRQLAVQHCPSYIVGFDAHVRNRI